MKHDPNIGFKDGTRTIWNKGLTKETDDRVKKISKKVGDALRGKKQSFKAIEAQKRGMRLSEIVGGYREGSGRGKKFKVFDSYNNRVCLQSSYELYVSEILDRLNIKWIRPKYLIYIVEKR